MIDTMPLWFWLPTAIGSTIAYLYLESRAAKKADSPG